MKKVIIHNGVTFTIIVTVNHTAERRVGGGRTHLMEVFKDLSDNKPQYIWSIDAAKGLKEEVEKNIRYIIQQNDKISEDSEAINILTEMGFEKYFL